MNYDLTEMQHRLEKKLTPERYQHTLGVMYTCAALAMSHGYDMEKALVAGLLHDCAKCVSNEKKIKICEKHDIPISESEQNHPFLLHAKVGAHMARKKYGVEDEEILDAIRYHTTGRPDMTLLEKITYIADYIEPWRNKAPNLDEIRKSAYSDIDTAAYLVLRDTLDYLKQTGEELDPMTQVAYEFYAEIYQQKLGVHWREQ